MNKKFSTLLAGVALLSAMSANAQTTPAQNVLPTANELRVLTLAFSN